jgi:hypothetical protein
MGHVWGMMAKAARDKLASGAENPAFYEHKLVTARFFFERIDGLLPEALAWIPQSTVACVINRALLNLAVNVPQVELMLQVHDSLVGQYRTVYEKTVLPSVHENMLITIPYPDPLIIPCGIKTSRVSWGAVEEAKWPE